MERNIKKFLALIATRENTTCINANRTYIGAETPTILSNEMHDHNCGSIANGFNKEINPATGLKYLF